MKDGFIKVAAITPKLKVCDIDYNTEVICKYVRQAALEDIKIMVFPETSITGYTCQDLFMQTSLLDAAKQALLKIAGETEDIDALVAVGLPLSVLGKLYNVAAVICRGKIIGIVPKSYLPNYNEFYEARHFQSGKNLETLIDIGGMTIPVNTRMIFCSSEIAELRIAIELCEDLWVPNPPSIMHALNGANIILNLSASDEITGKASYRKGLVTQQSARLICGYIYASAGSDESTQDVVYSGHNIIAENGKLLAESRLYSTGIISTEIDVKRIEADRRRMSTYENENGGYISIPFSLNMTKTTLSRFIDPSPFVPSAKNDRDARCEEILLIQAQGLKKRLKHIGCKQAVIGISGGLDSTLALLVVVKAFDLLGLDHKGIIAVTMPGFGTTNRTYDNAINLIKCLNASLREISIVEAVNGHFKDIGHDPAIHDVTYENCQARERTQIIMDIANQTGGIVIGTGDLSELALGWATYNGDHMSMYAVNASVPKTLVRHLVGYYADTCKDELLSKTLLDVLDTPVSPELLPPENGKLSQITESLVGPYELHDFFLYHMLRGMEGPAKIYRLAKIAFSDKYDEETILKWERIFYKRFFAQHFKRSCLPDGPKVGTVSVSPRGDLRMPTDASANIWLKELENL